jgi:hypothetical protein
MKKFFTVFILLLFCAIKLEASINGAQIEYVSLGNKKYAFTVTVYRNCGGSFPYNTSLDMSCSQGSASFWLIHKSNTDVTEIGKNCNTTSRCGGGLITFDYGVEKHVYEGTLDLSAFSSCEFDVTWQMCCSPAEITTAPASKNIVLHAMINTCLQSSISWSKFIQPFLLELGQDQNLNFSANDADHDSVSYKRLNPMFTPAYQLPYYSPFTVQNPITYLGFPNAGLSSPAGIHFDEERGNLSFRPTVKDEATNILVEATEWRKINGTMTIIGKVQRLITGLNYKASSNSNNLPIQPSVNTFAACPGDTSVAIINFSDVDTDNAYTVNLEHNLKWASAKILGDSTSKKIMVSFLVDSIPPQGITNAFTVEVYDNACPLRGRSVKTYSLADGGSKFDDSSYIIKSKACMHAMFKPGNCLTGSNFEYTWLITSKKKKQGGTIDNFDFLAADTGWVKAQLWVTSTSHCNYFTYTDSIYISPSDAFGVEAGNDTSVCNGAAVTLQATPFYGTAPIKYSWTGGDTTATTSVTPKQGFTKYFITLTDGKGCVATDWVLVTNYQPQIKLTADTIICKNDSTILAAAIFNSIEYKTSSWLGKPAGVDTFVETLAAPQLYTYTVTDGPCKSSKSIFVDISIPVIKYTHDTTVCIGDTMVLTAATSGGLAPYTVDWLPYGKTGQTIYITTTNAAAGYTYFSTDVTDAVGCTASQTGSVWLNPKPVITFSPFAKACISSPQIDLTFFATPAGGNWSGKGIAGNELYPSSLGRGTHPFSYSYTDNTNGCVGKGNTEITVFAPPTIDFYVDSTTIIKGTNLHFTNLTTADSTFSSKWVFGLPATPANTVTYTNPNFVFNDTGFHSVRLVINDGVCPEDSIIKTNYIYVRLKNSADGINTPLANTVIIYPNPATDKLFVQIPDKTIKTVIITDITGKQINGYTWQNQNIMLGDVTQGVYFITVITTDNTAYKTRFMVE